MRLTEQEKAALERMNPSDRDRYERNLRELRGAFEAISKDPNGKIVLWWLLGECKIFSNAMTGNSQTYHVLGRQSVGQDILHQLTLANPQAWIDMQQEHMNEIQEMLNSKESN